MADDFVALLALDADKNELFPNGGFDTKVWEKLVSATDALNGQHWILAYEAAVQHWLSGAAAAVAVVIGHMYPVFFRFQGGKGVSTALGVLAALSYYLAAGAAATWLIIAFFFRISSLAALISALFAPFFCFLLYGMHPVTVAVLAISLLLIWRHKTNIRNLLAGKEGRLGSRDSGSSQN